MRLGIKYVDYECSVEVELFGKILRFRAFWLWKIPVKYFILKWRRRIILFLYGPPKAPKIWREKCYDYENPTGKAVGVLYVFPNEVTARRFLMRG